MSGRGAELRTCIGVPRLLPRVACAKKRAAVVLALELDFSAVRRYARDVVEVQRPLRVDELSDEVVDVVAINRNAQAVAVADVLFEHAFIRADIFGLERL